MSDVRPLSAVADMGVSSYDLVNRETFDALWKRAMSMYGNTRVEELTG